MGKLLTPDVAPVGDAPLTDGAPVNALMFPDHFPYLNTPIPGSPNTSITIGVQTSTKVQGGFTSVKPQFDESTRRISVAKPAGTTGFMSISSDHKVILEDTRVGDNTISAKVK
jgi:hypothetical protein